MYLERATQRKRMNFKTRSKHVSVISAVKCLFHYTKSRFQLKKWSQNVQSWRFGAVLGVQRPVTLHLCPDAVQWRTKALFQSKNIRNNQIIFQSVLSVSAKSDNSRIYSSFLQVRHLANKYDLLGLAQTAYKKLYCAAASSACNYSSWAKHRIGSN